MKNSSRHAFTLVELLIVIAIIGALMALLLPAVNSAREKGRQASCLNNQQQLAKAMVSFATDGKGNFPGWAQDQKVGTTTTTSGTTQISWAAKLLPKLDEKGLWDQLLLNDGSFQYDSPPKRDIFLCPSDARTNPKIGGLTYVVNSGMPDPLLDTLTSASDLKANGICHDLRSGRDGPVVRLGADIKDGANTTLLLSENVHKDEQAYIVGRPVTWLGPMQDDDTLTPPEMASNPEQRFGMVWIYDPATAPAPPATTIFDRFSRDTRDDTSTPYGEITSGSRPVGSRFMRPASAHPEIFIAAFCSGTTKSISENVEYQVYQQLMTPNGAKAAAVLDPTNPATEFLTPPLSDSDY